MAERLSSATSPYLLQHVSNPVDWWPWGTAALAEAARLERPLFISIGYSSCHWCHVMAHESFDDPAVAALMNAAFVNVKVDREERPDVDAVYMDALQVMTGRGGWPLSVFAAPDGRPFYAGTYFPPTARHGLPAWRDVVTSIAEAWRTRRADIESHADALVAALVDKSPPSAAGSAVGALDEGLLARATERLLATIDPVGGGFGGAPKFPQAGALAFLLRRHARTGSAAPLEAVAAAMDAMLAGGLHDQLAGGFHRYCVDATWTVPHYEKMLYDNAQLLALLAELHQLTGAPRYAEGAHRTANYVLKALRSPDGGFFSAQDADTTEGEGAYHTWTPDELAAVLDPSDLELAAAWYGVNPSGNTDDGRSVLTARRDPVGAAAALGCSVDALFERVATIRSALLAARERRPAPATDTKIIVGWNALAIDALARAGSALGEGGWIRAAETAAAFLFGHVRSSATAGGLAHHTAAGAVGVPAFCDDVACLANACVSLYGATFDPRWRDEAVALTRSLVADFTGPDGGAFYRTAAYHEALAVRAHDVVDGATPSGNAAASLALLRVAALVDDAVLADRAAEALAAIAHAIPAAPLAFGDTLVAVDVHVAGMRTVTFDRPPSADDSLGGVVRGRFNVGTVVRVRADSPTPLPSGRRPAAEVCVRGRCLRPVDDPAALAADLAATDGGEFNAR